MVQNGLRLIFLTPSATKIKLTQVYSIGPDMRQHSSFQGIHILPGLLMFLFASAVLAQKVAVNPVNIFGDGIPLNGIEDSREPLVGGRHGSFGLADQKMNAGTVTCDGQVRGTAMVVDTREFVPRLKGIVLASAAHVIFDIEKRRRFRYCTFSLLALDEIPGYRAEIDLGKIIMGAFDPIRPTGELAFGEGDWSFLYVPKPWKNFNPDEALMPRAFTFSQLEAYQQSGGELRLIAYDPSARVMSVSRGCTVVESNSDDLGGGAWRGQLLDDCDSTGGASGGGFVAASNGQQFLIGIRTGSHWSNRVYPADEFPLGPPDGAVWNRYVNTNFGRAYDADIIVALVDFLQDLAGK
jgi:hypothetical protein